MNTVILHIGDVRDVMSTMPASSVDLIVTSPPFLALRSYLPADHPDKHREIGSEATPAAYLDTLLDLTQTWRRLLTPTGSLAVELGDTYSGGGGWGDYPDEKNARRNDFDGVRGGHRVAAKAGGWPLPKSLCGIPTLYAWSLAYGRNLLNPDHRFAPYRVRNLLVWTRPNPPVGALGDKFRPATSYVTVACTSDRRWFDLDAVRVPHTKINGDPRMYTDPASRNDGGDVDRYTSAHPAGAPPLDWWDEDQEDAWNLTSTTSTTPSTGPSRNTEPNPKNTSVMSARRQPESSKSSPSADDNPDPDWQPLHRLPTHPYKGAHYATYPPALPRRLIAAMCPRQVCVVCGEARRRVTAVDYVKTQATNNPSSRGLTSGVNGPGADPTFVHGRANKIVDTLGWTNCHCNDDTTLVQTARAVDPRMAGYRPGIVCDPFAGSGTTAIAAAQVGRDSVLIDLDWRNVELIRQRLEQNFRIVDETVTVDGYQWTVETVTPQELSAIHNGQEALW